MLICFHSVLTVKKRQYSIVVGTRVTATTRVNKPTGPHTCIVVCRPIRIRLSRRHSHKVSRSFLFSSLPISQTVIIPTPHHHAYFVLFNWLKKKFYTPIISMIINLRTILLLQTPNKVGNMSLVMRKPVFGVCDKVRLKPTCSITETS